MEKPRGPSLLSYPLHAENPIPRGFSENLTKIMHSKEQGINRENYQTVANPFSEVPFGTLNDQMAEIKLTRCDVPTPS